MNRRSAYAVFALFPLIDLFFVMRPFGMWGLVLHAAICGAALYYVIHHIKPFGLWSVVMMLIAILYNPFRPFQFGEAGWIVTDIIVMVLFYFLARITPIDEKSGVRRYASEDEYNATKGEK